MKLNKKLVSACLLSNFVIGNVPLAAMASSEITKNTGNFKTETDILNTGNVYNIKTETSVKGGTIGINSFDKFNVGKGDIVNLNLINSQNKLVNLIFDNSPSQINGIVNSYMGGKIGGNVLFANSHGFVIGQSGVFNVGSLTLMTPTQSAMEDLLNDKILGGGFNEEKVDRLVSFTFNDQNYLLNGNKYEPVGLAVGKIEIDGTINAGKGINLISGSNVDLLSNSSLNANMDFVKDALTGQVTAKPLPIVQSSESVYPKNLAMQDGKDIVIVASNNNVSSDMLSAIVNLNGKVNANGGDLIVRTEVFQTDKNADAKSQINVKNNSVSNANNIVMNAVTNISSPDKNIIGVTDLSKEFYYGYLGEVVNFIVNDFINLSNVDTSINVEKGAKIEATKDVSLGAISEMKLSTSFLASAFPDINFNFTSVKSNTNATVKNGSTITAENLNVDSTTKLKLSTSTKSTNIADSKTGLNIGSYALGVTTTDIKNKAEIENGATLNINKDITVSAKTESMHSDIAKNGLVPVIDKNHGTVGAAMSVIVSNVNNEAIMNANADINGKLLVDANYKGNIVSSVSGYSGGEGEDGFMGNLFKHFKSYDKITEVVSRSNAKFNDTDIAGGVGIVVDKVNSSSKIGDVSKNIKPTITAGQVEVKAETIDEKSTLYVQAESENGATCASGALAVNYKDLNSDANAYGDFILTNTKDGDALTIKSNTEVIHPMAWLDWIKTFTPFFKGETWNKAGNAVKDKWNNIETNNVTDYLAELGAVSELSTLLDEGGFDIFNAIDFGNAGAYGFFNTFTQSKTDAKTNTGNTKAMAGAISIALHNTNSHATLNDNSTVLLRTTDVQKAGVNISANANNEIWTGASLLKLAGVTELLSGSSARDGSGYGVTGAFSYSDSDITAKIGNNVTINKDANFANSVVGNVDVKAKENGNYLTISAGSSSPDNTGLSGSIGMTMLGNGKVKSSIEKNASIYANNVNVGSSKDDNFINAILSFANGQNSYGFGLSGVILTDGVESYIAGDINALGSVGVNGVYDKSIINANANLGIAKKGTDDPAGKQNKSGDDIENYWGLRELFDEGTSDLNWYNLIKKYKRKSEKIDNIVKENDKDYDYTRPLNPDKETKAAAGGINLTLARNTVSASIKDGANVSAEKDVTVNAKSTDNFIDTAAVVAANGKSGAGGTIMADISNSNVNAIVEKATINAKEATEVTAKEDFNLIAASAGVSTGKDKAGAGNVSSAVQVNNVTAAIKDGSKVNENLSGLKQTVKVESTVDSDVIKAVGAIAVQKGGKGESGGGSKGGTVDGDVVSNTINAYVSNSNVNASKLIDVKATNNDNLIVVDVAGSVSTQNSAYGGTIGAYVAVNDINAYIDNSNINQSNTSTEQEVNVSASSTFKEIGVVGTVAAGNKTGVGASNRVDAVVNNINSYIKNSTVKATKSVNLTNADSISQISVAVAGAGSSDSNAGAGVLNVLADVVEQNNYIENSALTVGDLKLDTDKTMDTITVTGAIAAAPSGKSVGLSGYAVGASHDINTYIKNSDVISAKDITLTSDFVQDSMNIIFGGAGGKGFTGSGAISVVVNNSNVNTYILSENNSSKKNIKAENGKVTVKSENDIDTLTVNGNVGISTGGVAAGGAIATTVYNSTINSGIDGVELTTKNGVDILAKANQNHGLVVVGLSGGDGVSVDGSISTMVMNQNMYSYLKNSTVKTDSDVSVNSDDTLIMGNSLGAVAVSMSSASVGASVLTSVVNGDVKAEIDNVEIDKNNNSVGDLKVKAKQYDEYTGFAISGSVGNSAAVSGAANTIVQNKDVTANVNKLSTKSKVKEVNVIADSETNMLHVAGQVSASISSAGVGGSVSTLVSNKKVKANVTESDVFARGNVNVSASSKEKMDSNAVGGSGAAQVAVNGSINTVVSSNTVEANVKKSSIETDVVKGNDNGVKVSSSDDLTIVGRTGAIAGSGSVAAGGAIITGVVNNTVKSIIENSDVEATNANVLITSSANETLGSSSNPFITIAASGSGKAAVSGAIDTIVLNSNSISKVSGYKTTTKGIQAGNEIKLDANGKTTLFVSGGGMAGAGAVGVGLTVNTLVVNKTIKANVENSNVKTEILKVLSSADDEFNTVTVAGAGGGAVGVGGDISTNVISSTVESKISGGIVSANDNTVSANADADFLDIAGSLGIGGTAGVGATVSTNIIGYNVKALIDNAVVEDFSKINVSATSNETYNFNAVTGAGGTAGVAGVVYTNLINNTVEAEAKGTLTGKTNSVLNVNAKDEATYSHLVAGTIAGGVAGVGGTITTNSITSTVLASTGGTVNVKDLSVTAEGIQKFEDMYVVGLAGGGVGVSGSALAVISDATIKAYTADNSNLTVQNLTLDAKNTTNISEVVGTVSAGGVAVGASVGVNKITNTVEAYTGKNNTIVADNNIKIKAISTNNLGNENKNLWVVAGSGGVAGVAGAVLVNYIEDNVNAFVGTSNNILNAKDLSISATANSNIYETIGGVAVGGLLGVGASVGVNTIGSTAVANIGSNSVITMSNGNVEINAETNETIVGNGYVVSGGKYALNGGVLFNTIGESVANASSNKANDEETDKVYNSAQKQSQEILTKSADDQKQSNDFYNKYYNKAVEDLNTALKDVETNAETLSQQSDKDLFKKSSKAIATYNSTDRANTTSAFVDSNTNITAKDVTISAKNKNNVDVEVNGASLGAAAVGVSAAVSNVNTTTNAFVSNNSNITAGGKLEIKSNSEDTQNVTARAASGGIVSGSGAVAIIKSNKTTNAYVLTDSSLTANKDLAINTKSISDTTATTLAGSFGGVSVGVSISNSEIKGNTKVDIGNNVALQSTNGNINVKAETDEKSTANATAATGSLIGGSGAEATAKTGKTNTVNVGKNVNIVAKLASIFKSIGKNNSIAETNARAYGGISVGGTKTNAKIAQNSGVNFADSDRNSQIKAGEVTVSSEVNNKVDAKTKAGAGAAVGISGSGVVTDINSTNNVYVGKNRTVNTAGKIEIAAQNINTYKAYNDSSSYGIVGATVGTIDNSVTSTVDVVSNANINAGRISIIADNQIKKSAVSNYDLFGGAGGIVGVGSASLSDKLTMTTNATMNGNYAHANGIYGSGAIIVSSKGKLDVNEKVDVTAAGGIPVSDGNVSVDSTVKTTTTISNKDIQTKDDNIYYLADNDIDIYTKSNVKSYGGIAIAEGSSKAHNNEATAFIDIKTGVNSISGRDTYVQSTSDKNIQSYMYAETKGLIGTTGSSTAESKNKSVANILIDTGANVKAYDSITLAVIDSTSKVSAKRDAKGTTYLLFGIPITIYGDGHEYTTNNSDSYITLKGNVESGLGANRKLTINNDGSWTTDGINVIGKEKVGEVTSADLDSDINAYENSRKGELKVIDDYIEIEKNLIAEADKSIQENTNKKAERIAENQKYDTAINNANTIIENNNQIENIDIVTEAWDSAYGVDTENNATLSADFGITLSKFDNDSNLSGVKTAYAKYEKSQTATNLEALKTSVENLATKKTDIQKSTDSISNTITEIASIDVTKNDNLNSFIKTTQDEIKTNNETIANIDSAIRASQKEKDTAKNSITDAETSKVSINTQYDAIIKDLNDKKSESSTTPVYSLMVDNVYVRSGDVKISGKTVGNGKITAAGNKFSIDIINNSVSDVVYKDLQIARNATGNIYGSNIASSISKNYRNTDNGYSISVTNTVDANDPTINLDNGFGDMIFKGNVENVNGLVSFVNYTGNILSDGSITAKNLKIAVPNGGYTQNYDNSRMMIGGTSADGAIIASGDIDISSKVIDINGLIQSGSEIKSVTIPDFKVVKENGVYYQVAKGQKTKMEKGTSEGYYYLNLDGNGQLDSELEMIKAYFKPSDISDVNNIKGDIHLFKAEIEGGNITLTGNIVSTSNKGQIVLVNGYGHIDVKNNSNHNLVTSALNADAKIQGKLTINDLKFSDQSGNAFDNIKQSDITKSWLAKNAGTYTANVDEKGNISTTSTGQTADNGSWGATSSSTRNDGATIKTIIYNPGNDAYYEAVAGSVEVKSYQKYVKRSWWTELWHGKLYQTIYYTVSHDPQYALGQNAIQVKFQGFDKPHINVTSNGSVVMNSSMSALTGNIDVISKNGSILTNSSKNVISAENIKLISEKGDIGSQTKNIQTAIYNKGLLSGKGNNIYINYPYSDISNINIEAKDNAYLATSGEKLGGLDSIVNIKANSLELKAENGTINLDATQNTNINIDVNKVKARAKDDISIINKGDLKISSITSENQGTITLGSEIGSIVATDTETINPYHINGGNVILNAVNGSVGTSSNVIKIAKDGIFKVYAKDDVNLSSVGRIYVDSILSNNGKVTLNADYGIIASKNTDNLAYNIASLNGIDLNSKHGNIENIGINTNGVINASAGYDNNVASGMSDISISLISKQELSQDILDSLTTDEQKQQVWNEYNNGLKDMKIGTIQASKNVFLTSEKSIINGVSNSNIKGEQIILSAGVGNIGADNSAINLTANRDITAYAGNGASVYLSSEKDLKINEIRSYNTKDESTGTVNAGSILKNVVLNTNNNIANASNIAENANVVGENIVLNAKNDIGSKIKFFKVDTTDDTNGLSFDAQNAYINGVGHDLNIVSSNSKGDTNILSDLSVKVKDTVANGDLIIDSSKDTILAGNVAANKININSANETNLSNIVLNSDLENTSTMLTVENSELKNIVSTSTNANILGSTVNNDAQITTTETTTISNSNFNNNLKNDSNISIVDGLSVADDVEITTTEKTTIGTANISGNLTNNSTNTEITELTVAGNANVTSTENTTIGTANISGNLTNNSTNTEISELTVAGNANVTSTENTTIGTANISGNLTNNSTNTEISDLTVGGNVNITSSENTKIAKADVQGDFVNKSKNTEISNKLTVKGDANLDVENSVSIANADLKNLKSTSTTANISNVTVADDVEVTTTENTTIGTANISGNLTNNSTNTEITELTVGGNANITSSDNTKIAKADVQGDFVNKSKDTEISNKLTVKGDANLDVENSVSIANADLKKDMNIKAKDVEIREIDLKGNFNSSVDNIEVKTTKDINIGYVNGNSNDYVNKVKISSDKSILNGRSDSGYNFNVKNLNLKAGESLGSENKTLNLKLADDNTLTLVAGDGINIHTEGATVNYTTLNSNSLTLSTDANINIDTLKVKDMTITTSAPNLSINSMEIGQTGTLNVGKKHIVIDNTNMQPMLYVDVQMRLNKSPASIKVDETNNIVTDSINVLRQNRHISVNDSKYYTSMNNSSTTAGASMVEKMPVSEKPVERGNSTLYEMPTQFDYDNLYVKRFILQSSVKNQVDEAVTTNNAFEIVNAIKNTTTPQKKRTNILSKKQIQKNKVSSL